MPTDREAELSALRQRLAKLRRLHGEAQMDYFGEQEERIAQVSKEKARNGRYSL